MPYVDAHLLLLYSEQECHCYFSIQPDVPFTTEAELAKPPSPTSIPTSTIRPVIEGLLSAIGGLYMKAGLQKSFYIGSPPFLQ